MGVRGRAFVTARGPLPATAEWSVSHYRHRRRCSDCKVRRTRVSLDA
jgi:hypothetical protein